MSIQNLLDEVEILKRNTKKFERGNKSAGTRARKSLQKHQKKLLKTFVWRFRTPKKVKQKQIKTILNNSKIGGLIPFFYSIQ